MKHLEQQTCSGWTSRRSGHGACEGGSGKSGDVAAAAKESTWIDCFTRSLPSLGTDSMYTVSSKEVYAFWQAPNAAPMDSKYSTSSSLS